MKKPTHLLLTAALLLGSLTACMKKDYETYDLSNDMVRVSTFSAQIDTSLWTAQDASYYSEGGKLVVMGNHAGIDNSPASGMKLAIDTYSGRGTYNLDSNLNPAACSYNGIVYKAQSGQLTISQDDSDRLSGNFVMTASSDYGSILVTDGKFTYYKRK